MCMGRSLNDTIENLQWYGIPKEIHKSLNSFYPTVVKFCKYTFFVLLFEY